MTAKEAQAFVGDVKCVVNTLQDDKLFLDPPSSSPRARSRRQRRDTRPELLDLMVRSDVDTNTRSSFNSLHTLIQQQQLNSFSRKNANKTKGQIKTELKVSVRYGGTVINLFMMQETAFFLSLIKSFFFFTGTNFKSVNTSNEFCQQVYSDHLINIFTYSLCGQ